jgi:CubicO group peptidase (beta-lactamase class C family)
MLDRIDAIAQRALDESEAQGVAIGIATRDGERILRTYGFANRDAEFPVGEETLFEIGSISKSFLAIVYMQLAAEGTIDLHAPVTDYLPWFAVRSDHAPITTHHLLCHTAGLPAGFEHRPDGLFALWELRNVRPGAPGELWHYSNVGYSLLGALAEAILGQSFDQILTERVLAPLGFAHSTASVVSAQRPELAVGYKRQFDDRPWRSGTPVFPATWLETSSGAGSIVMDVSDMLGYAEFLLRTWDGTDSPVLTTAQLHAMVDPSRLPEPAADEEHGYGLYWGTNDAGEIIFLGHGGDMVGYESDLLVDIANGICVVMLASGAVPDYQMTNDVRKLVAASNAGEPLPELSTETLRSYDGADAWSGEWHSSERAIEIEMGDDGLTLLVCDERIPLQRSSRRSNNYLTVDHFDWDRFLLEAVRDNDDDADDETLGPIVKLHYGHETFVRAGEPLPETPVYPDEWNGYAGFYRSYNPWYPSFRVVLRDGTLVLIDGSGDASTLLPEDDGFRVGAEPPNFDWLIFHPIIDGQAHGIRFETGAEYNRFFAA